MNKYFIFSMMFFNLVFPFQLLADHLDDNQIAKGKAEHVMCGIDVYKTKPKQAIDVYGKPTTVEILTDKESGPNSDNGNKDYNWQWAGLKMSLETGFYTDKKTKIIIESGTYVVDVWGGKSKDKVGLTGRGLALGDTLSEVQEIYGTRFQKGRTSDTNRLYLLIEWKDGTQLSVDFDKDEKINHMQLMAEIE